MLAETTEIFGAEHLLVKRARNREVADKLLGCIREYKRISDPLRGQLRRQSHRPATRKAASPTSWRRSLGAVAKGGTSPLIDVYDYAERMTAPGFIFMNTPGYDPVIARRAWRRAAAT